MIKSVVEQVIINLKIEDREIEVDGQVFFVGQSKTHELSCRKMTIIAFAQPKAHESEIHEDIPAIIFEIGGDYRIIPASLF